MPESKPLVCVITGASSGIGAAVAERLAQDGATVALVARGAPALEVIAARCSGRGHVVPADVTRREEVRRVVAEVHARHGRIDVWINNVGQGITRLPTELTDGDIDEMVRVNVKSALYGMQEVLPVFRRQGTGHIINISSMLGRIPYALPRAAYSGAKHFLNALTDNFRTEVQRDHPGIQVSLVSPGLVYTEFGRNAVHGGPLSQSFPNGQSPAEVAEIIAGVVASRVPDQYTRPGSKARVIEHYNQLGQDPEPTGGDSR